MLSPPPRRQQCHHPAGSPKAGKHLQQVQFAVNIVWHSWDESVWTISERIVTKQVGWMEENRLSGLKPFDAQQVSGGAHNKQAMKDRQDSVPSEENQDSVPSQDCVPSEENLTKISFKPAWYPIEFSSTHTFQLFVWDIFQQGKGVGFASIPVWTQVPSWHRGG